MKKNTNLKLNEKFFTDLKIITYNYKIGNTKNNKTLK